MKNALIGFFSLLLVATVSHARPKFSSQVKSFAVGGEIGTVHAEVRKDGHLLGQPYVIELKATCGLKNKTLSDLQVRDVKSACLAFPSTLKLSSDKKKITIEIQEVDVDFQTNYALKQHPQKTTKTRCLPEKVIFEFVLQGLCDTE